MRNHLELEELGSNVIERNRQYKELEDIERVIARRKGEIEAANERTRREGPLYDLACTLHSKNCSSNHTDGCGWYYEMHRGVHDWTGHAHQRYLEQARDILKLHWRQVT